MKYKATYKCRMCGKTFIDGTVSKKSVGEVAHLLSVKDGSESPFCDSQIHLCDNGSIGIAYFQGFQKKALSEKRNMSRDSKKLRNNILNFLMIALIVLLMLGVPMFLALMHFAP